MAQSDIPINAEVIYAALRSGSEFELKLFLERGMLEWLREYVYLTNMHPIKLVQSNESHRNELIILMTNMMEVNEYGFQSEN